VNSCISANLGSFQRGLLVFRRAWPGTIACTVEMSLLGKHALTMDIIPEPKMSHENACGGRECSRRGWVVSGEMVEKRRGAVEGRLRSHFRVFFTVMSGAAMHGSGLVRR
jgi:hypothetical protein